MEQAAYGLIAIAAVVEEVAFCVDDEVAVDEAVFDDAAGMGIVLYEVVEFFIGDGDVVVAESAVVKRFHLEQFPAVDLEPVQVMAELFVHVEPVYYSVDLDLYVLSDEFGIDFHEVFFAKGLKLMSASAHFYAGGVVERVDGKANHVKVRCIFANPGDCYARAVGDDRSLKTEVMSVFDEFIEMRIEQRFAAGEVDGIYLAGIVEVVDDLFPFGAAQKAVAVKMGKAGTAVEVAAFE